MNFVSDEAWELLEVMISVGAFSEADAVSPKALRAALDIADRAQFDSQIKELLDAPLIIKFPPQTIDGTVTYCVSAKHVAEYAGVDQDAVLAQADHSDVSIDARIVTLDQDLPEYLTAKEGISELREAVRSLNHLPNRDNITNALIAADVLWGSSELTIIQIKVGVILAIEEAGRALVKTAKAVATALFIDAIKSLVKSKTSIDLDHL